MVYKTPVCGKKFKLVEFKTRKSGGKKEGIKKADSNVFHYVPLDYIQKHRMMPSRTWLIQCWSNYYRQKC